MLRNLRAAFDRAWLDAICKQGAKLRTYSLFKTHFQAECYLSKVRIAAHRFSLSRLRMSGHFLRIETGRFQRHSHIPASERFCKLCNTGEVEDEFHFLIRCPLYKALRENLYTAADLSCKNFLKLDEKAKFIYLLSCENDLIAKVAEFCYHAFCRRDAELIDFSKDIKLVNDNVTTRSGRIVRQPPVFKDYVMLK